MLARANFIRIASKSSSMRNSNNITDSPTYIWKGRTLWLCPPEMKLVWGSYIYLWLVKSPMGKILTSAGGPGGSPTRYLVNRGIWHPQKSTLGQKTFNNLIIWVVSVTNTRFFPFPDLFGPLWTYFFRFRTRLTLFFPVFGLNIIQKYTNWIANMAVVLHKIG